MVLCSDVAVQIYAHLSWTTIDRHPRIGETERDLLRRFLPTRAHKHGARVLALGIVSDHLHLVLEIPGEFNVPKMVQSMKGASARVANRDPDVSKTGLRWARGYDFRSVSPKALKRAVAYVNGQGSRHPDAVISTKARG